MSQTNPRFDLYATIHKGLRARMFDTTALVARTDFSNDAETAATTAALADLLELLDEHAAHEDAHVMPEVGAVAPDVAAALELDHGALHDLQRELRRRLELIATTPAARRWTLGRELHLRLCRMVADHLRHMDREETLANAALWAGRTDEQLMTVSGRISSSIAEPRLIEWWTFVLPALDGKERATVLRGMRDRAPGVYAALARDLPSM